MSQQEAAYIDDTMHRACKLMASCLIMSVGDPVLLITPFAPSMSPLRDLMGTMGYNGVGWWKGSAEVEDEGGTAPL